METNELYNAGKATVKGVEFLTSINNLGYNSKFKLPLYLIITHLQILNKFSDDFEEFF